MRHQTRAARSIQQDARQERTLAPETRALEFAALHSGQPLEGGVRSAMEQRFDHSFGNVRVHDDSQAMSSASSVSAKAYTVGSQIVLGERSAGFGAERILVHELAHVVQNERFGAADNARISADHDSSELEAHGAANRGLSGSSVAVQTAPSAAIATWPDWLDEAAHSAQQFGSGLMQEGFGGLGDVSGMMDRQRAQEELSNRFTVDDGAISAGAAPNVVSSEEYQRIARTYSDVRLGRGDLSIDTSSIDSQAAQGSYGMTPEAYRAGAMNDIASMMQTRSGRTEIEALHDNPLVSDAGEARNDFMGFELPQLPFDLDAGLGNPIRHRTTMVPLLNDTGGANLTNGYAAPDGGGDLRDPTTGERGSGTDVHIRYNPGVNIGDNQPGTHAASPWMESFRSDVLLAHEMNHAIQQTQGTGDSTAVQAIPDWSTTGEGIDAAYRDENGNPLRRIEHQAVGIGQSRGNDMTENAYRRERRAMADLGAVGLVVGRDGVDESDAVLTERDSYVPVNDPAPAPAPTGTGAPAVPNAPWPMLERD